MLKRFYEKAPKRLLIPEALYYLYHAKSKDMRNLQEEIWKPIPAHQRYSISSFGRVKSFSGKILKPLLTTSGYHQIQLSEKGVKFQYRIHRIVANVFVSNSEKFPEVNHLDGVKINNKASNLQWCTRSMNVKHAYDNSLNPNARPVSCFKNGVLIKTYPSARSAELDGYSNQLISKCCNGLRSHHKNLNWEYASINS